MAEILVLGAGVFQLNLIRKIQNLGHKAIVASYPGDFPGIKLADEFVALNITDYKGLSAFVAKRNVDAVITTGSDVSIPTIGKLVEEHTIVGPTYFAANTVSSKTNFRDFQCKHNLNSPHFLKTNSLKEYLSFIENNKGKLVVKPDDSSGSRGVYFLNSKDSIENLATNFKSAIGYSRNGFVCLEGFIDGFEVGGDAFLVNGEVEFIATTTKHLKGALVLGHTIPGNINSDKISEIKKELESVCNKLDYKFGPVNFDVMISDDAITIIEMGLRNGGNGIVDLINLSFGVDLNEKLIQRSLNEQINIKVNNSPEYHSSFVFGATKNGVLSYIIDFETLKKDIPEVIHMVLARNIGDEVEELKNNSNLIGYLLLKCNSEQYIGICSKLNNLTLVKVD